MKSHLQNDERVDRMIDEFFELKEFGSADFTKGTIVRLHKIERRRQIVRFAAWGGVGVAASLLLSIGILSRGASEAPEIVKTASSDTFALVDEVSIAMEAADRGDFVGFYEGAFVIEDLVFELAGFSEEESDDAFEFFMAVNNR